MQVNGRDVLVIFPTKDSQLFSSLHHSLSKSIVKEMPIKFNPEFANVRNNAVGVADKTKGTKRRKQQHTYIV